MSMEERKDPRHELIGNRDVQRELDAQADDVNDHSAEKSPPAGEASDSQDQIETTDFIPLPPGSDPQPGEAVATEATGADRAASAEGKTPTNSSSESDEQGPAASAEPTAVPRPVPDERALLALATVSLARAEAMAKEIVKDLVRRPADSSRGEVERLPTTVVQQEPAIGLFADGVRSAGPSAGAPSTAEERFSFYTPPRGTSTDVQRLVIEVEVTLANGQRVSQIAVGESKQEFKRLAAAAVYNVKENLREFRESYRAVWGR